MNEGPAKAAVRALLKGMEDNDREALRACLTEDAQWWVPESAAARGLARPTVGVDEVSLLASGNRTKAFTPGTTTFDVQYMIAEGDFVASLMRRKSIGSNGADYENEYCWFFRVRDGRVAEIWEVIDTASAYDVLGRAPFAAAGA